MTWKHREVRKQLDGRWKQIDRFETSVKNLAEVKHTWRRKYNTKEGELEAIKVRFNLCFIELPSRDAQATNIDLASQVSILRRQPHTDQSELRSLTARATNAERRLANAQNQLAAAEERVLSLNEKTSMADSKWEARVKEYESRLKAAEERVKRERQGGKERINELEANVGYVVVSEFCGHQMLMFGACCYRKLQRHLELANKRNHQLGNVVEDTKPVTEATNGR